MYVTLQKKYITNNQQQDAIYQYSNQCFVRKILNCKKLF